MEAVEGRKKRESKEEDEDERRKGGRRGGSKPQYLGASCIRITKVKVPAAVEIGGAAELDCEWEREGDTMYSIKWYQGSTEFYRYTPSAQKQIQIFEPTTLDVDRARSSGGSVRVANITVEAEGPFHCEVSAEGPTFHTASDSAKMWVVALPNQGPIVNGVKGHYQVRDWVDLTCISPRSRPAPRLTFTINGSPASEGWLEKQKTTRGGEGRSISSLRLRFSLLPRLLQEGRALVTCLAEIPKLWQRETQVALSTRPSYQASVRGTTDGGGAGGGGGGDGGSSSLLFLLLLLLLLLFSQRHLLTWA
ncbi:uncharacterized protein LOC123519905 isoform X2 [Portunus trituberculatus]|uniref:uncharacterized protein LOC123519905 isoform X2 n=1 Tax=Portunus trituberculatus TaxID=210409 RepID=UPI001E1CD226|nr:uncharacterized protein LOC123519905 isoform X2 [Portunus trituberculatus]